MTPQLNHIYQIDELGDLLPILTGNYQTYPLPTEMVIYDAGFYAPQQGRIWRTDYRTAALPDRIIAAHRDELYKRLGSDKMWKTGEEIFLVEHYENWGDDGHTEMQLRGYIFVTHTDMQFEEKYGHKQFVYVEKMYQAMLEESHV